MKKSTNHFDASHNHEHALLVYQNAKEIFEHELGDAYDKEVIIYSALLHDVCDHKYPESIPFSEVIDFIMQMTNNEKCFTDDVTFLIENISYSKENK